MADIEVGVAVVGPGLYGDLIRLLAGAASPPGGIQVVEQMRPDVVEAQAQSVRHALGDRRLQRVVVGDRIVGAARDALKVRIGAVCRIVRRRAKLCGTWLRSVGKAKVRSRGFPRKRAGPSYWSVTSALGREVPLINLRNRGVVLDVAGALTVEPGWILQKPPYTAVPSLRP